jgi:hypothetical protein
MALHNIKDNENGAGNRGSGAFSRYRGGTALALIIILAGILRIIYPGKSPPGLNQDEAMNGWNAYCLLKTGKDQAGVSWPIFYTRGLGGNGSTLFIYYLIPFEAIGGLNIFTLRLAGAVGGVLTVAAIYYSGKRLFGTNVGLTAALLLALNPWHIQQSRWAHEATLCALLGIAPLLMLLWSGMPISDDRKTAPRVILAFLGGVISGVCCYGYHAVRIFIPIFLLVITILTLKQWRESIKTRKGILTAGGFILGFAITFGPLTWQHVFHPEGISRHSIAQNTMGNFLGSETLGAAIKNITGRYIQHFSPEFLFISGDHFVIQTPPGMGLFYWYMAPLMLLGLIFILKSFKSSVSVRTVLAFVIAYPVGDSLYQWASMHSLRSSPGLCGLILLGAVGGVFTAEWLWRRRRSLAWGFIIIFAAAAATLNTRYLEGFYGEYNREPEIYHLFQTDLVEACEWLKSRINDYDAVICTTNHLNMPYIITLVALDYEPKEWFKDQREMKTTDEWDYCKRYGKMFFLYENSFGTAESEIEKIVTRGKYRPGRVLLIIRPGEMLPNKYKPEIIHKVVRPDGVDALWLCRI